MREEFLLINEIFRSIQGESTWAGLPCTFVRLQGCPLRCNYCDTSYAFKEGQRRSLGDVLSEVLAIETRLVEITGGEPLLQPAVHPLMTALCDHQLNVLLETSGERDLSCCDPRVLRIIDIKTPCSGAAHSFLETNYSQLCDSDEIKFVITNREDFDWSVGIIEEHDLCQRVHAVHFSPVMKQAPDQHIAGCEELPPVVLANWILDSHIPVRFHLQVHKLIWPPETRGV